jgi:hypothetical protein
MKDKKRGDMVCMHRQTVADEEEGLPLLPFFEEEDRGYMVCTGKYVATNTRKQRRAARGSAENRLSPKGGPPQESLCMRDMTRGSASRTVSLNIRSVESVGTRSRKTRLNCVGDSKPYLQSGGRAELDRTKLSTVA